MPVDTRIEVNPVVGEPLLPVVVPADDDAGCLRQLRRRVALGRGLRETDSRDRRRVGFRGGHLHRIRRLLCPCKHRRRRDARRLGRTHVVRNDPYFVVRPIDIDLPDPERTGTGIERLRHIDPRHGAQQPDIEAVLRIRPQSRRKRYLAVHRQIPGQPGERPSDPLPDRRLVAPRGRRIPLERIAVIAHQRQFHRVRRPGKPHLEPRRTPGEPHLLAFGHIAVKVTAALLLEDEHPDRSHPTLRLVEVLRRPHLRKRRPRRGDRQAHDRLTAGRFPLRGPGRRVFGTGRPEQTEHRQRNRRPRPDRSGPPSAADFPAFFAFVHNRYQISH